MRRGDILEEADRWTHYPLTSRVEESKNGSQQKTWSNLTGLGIFIRVREGQEVLGLDWLEGYQFAYWLGLDCSKDTRFHIDWRNWTHSRTPVCTRTDKTNWSWGASRIPVSILTGTMVWGWIAWRIPVCLLYGQTCWDWTASRQFAHGLRGKDETWLLAEYLFVCGQRRSVGTGLLQGSHALAWGGTRFAWHSFSRLWRP